MAVMNINIQNRVNNPTQSIASTTSAVDAKQKDKTTAGIQSKDDKNKSQPDGVVSTSQDGDTFQASNASMRTNEGSVRLKDDSDKKASEDKQQDKQQKITSLAGYTKTQLDRLYREGKITQQEYDAQMQKRQDQLEEASDKNAELANTGAKMVGAGTRNELDNLAIKVTFSENSSDKIDAAQRYDAMQNIRQAQEGPTAQRTRNEERRLWDYQLQV